MTMDNAFYKSMDVSFVRSTAFRECKSISTGSLYFSKKNSCHFQVEAAHHNEPVISSWLITLGKGALLETQCWSLLLTEWAFSCGHSHIGLGEWKSMYEPMYNPSIPATMSFFMN